MKRLRDLSVGSKLLMALALSTGIALLVMLLVVSAAGLFRQKQQIQQQLTALADITGQNSQAALTFHDARSAAATLATLRANSLVAAAAIYDRDGRLFAALAAPARDPALPARLGGAADGDAIRISDMISGHAYLARPIALDGEKLGTVMLVADLHRIWNGWLTEMALLLTAAVAAFGIASLLAFYMRRLIAGPLKQLSLTVARVAKHQDYSLRVTFHGSDEVGLLGTHVNEMLAQIERRDEQLALHREELERIAHYDPLTGVPNRRLLADRLAQAIARARRSGKSMTVCYLDFDGFKPVNDQYGHTGGDILLVEIAERLGEVLRAEDTLARLGGDEFVMIFSELAQPEECHAILSRVLAAVSAPVAIAGIPVSISASIGATLFPADNVDADTLLRHADQAMYRAKEAGKNRYHLFDPGLDRELQARSLHQHRLREALKNDEFVLHYQPKVDLVSGAVIGAEALIRWQHPERGLLPPEDFLHYLYESDLEIPVGDWVIDTVLKQIKAWNAVGLALTVSANVSAAHLLHADFSERLRLSLERHPEVARQDLELEILETAALADMEKAIQVLARCRRLGVRFALDDFGTGYSSLTYFRNLPVDILKIDRSFVRNILDNPDDLGIVESVIKLAAAFNRPVIAEGVETLAIGTMLVGLGCRLAQGYGIAHPMPAAQFPGWTDAWRSEAAWLCMDGSAPAGRNYPLPFEAHAPHQRTLQAPAL